MVSKRALALVFLSVPIYAATYNFYFNNTEQGEHSTAQPSLNVQTQKAPNANSEEEKSEPKEPKIESVRESQYGTSSPLSPSLLTEIRESLQFEPSFYLHGSAAYASVYGTGGPGFQVGGRIPFSSSLSMSFSAGYQYPSYVDPVRLLYLASDLEWAWTTGGFEFGPLFGTSTIGKNWANWVSLHVGVFARFQLNKKVFVSSRFKVNLAHAMTTLGVEYAF